MKSYVTFMDYFATGEGRTIELYYCQAKNKKSALKKHLDFFGYKTKEAQDYFGLDIATYDVDDPKLESVLNAVFKGNSEWIYKVLREAVIDFSFKFYFNYS